jgi:hypothetical protein
MLAQDPWSGVVHDVDEAPDLSEYDRGRTVYDGLGQPLGVFPLIPLIASALPAIASAAKSVIPAITQIIPKVGSMVSNLMPQGGGAPAPMPAQPAPYMPPPGPAPAIVPVPGPVSPTVAPSGPGRIVVVRRPRRRRRKPMVVEDGRTGFLHELPFLPPSWWRARQMMQMRAPGYQRPYPVGWTTPALPYTGMQPRRLYMRCSVWPQRAGLVPQFANQMMPGTPGYPGMPGQPGMGGRRRRRGRRRR